jgi:hypothetical protein
MAAGVNAEKSEISEICNSYFQAVSREFLTYLKNNISNLSGVYLRAWLSAVDKTVVINSKEELEMLLKKIVEELRKKDDEYDSYYKEKHIINKPASILQDIIDRGISKLNNAMPTSSKIDLIYDEICRAEAVFLNKTQGLITKPLKSIQEIFDQLKASIKKVENQKGAQQYFVCYLEIVSKKSQDESNGEVRGQAKIALDALEIVRENLLSRGVFSRNIMTISQENEHMLNEISETIAEIEIEDQYDKDEAARQIVSTCIQQAILGYITNALIPVSAKRIHKCTELLTSLEFAKTLTAILQILRDNIYEIEQEHSEHGATSAFPFAERESRLARHLHLAHFQISKSIPQEMLPKQSIVMREIDKAILRYWQTDWFYHNKERRKSIRDLYDSLRRIEKHYQTHDSENVLAKNTEILAEINQTIDVVRSNFNTKLITRCYMRLGIKRNSRLVCELEHVRNNLQRINALPHKDLFKEIKPKVVSELNNLINHMPKLNQEDAAMVRGEMDALIIAIKDLKINIAESIELQIAACIRGYLEKAQESTFWQRMTGHTSIVLSIAVLLENILLQLQKDGFLPANTGYISVLVKIGEQSKDVANRLYQLESVMGKLPKRPEQLKAMAEQYKSVDEESKRKLQKLNFK